jgi:hypothetical protein
MAPVLIGLHAQASAAAGTGPPVHGSAFRPDRRRHLLLVISVRGTGIRLFLECRR